MFPLSHDVTQERQQPGGGDAENWHEFVQKMNIQLEWIISLSTIFASSI